MSWIALLSPGITSIVIMQQLLRIFQSYISCREHEKLGNPNFFMRKAAKFTNSPNVTNNQTKIGTHDSLCYVCDLHCMQFAHRVNSAPQRGIRTHFWLAANNYALLLLWWPWNMMQFYPTIHSSKKNSHPNCNELANFFTFFSGSNNN